MSLRDHCSNQHVEHRQSAADRKHGEDREDGKDREGGAGCTARAERYSIAIDQAVAATVRALLVAGPDGPVGARELRRTTTSLGATYGPDAVRDLAEALAGDLAELFGAFADANHLDPVAVHDEWTHDTPPRPTTPGDQQAGHQVSSGG